MLYDGLATVVNFTGNDHKNAPSLNSRLISFSMYKIGLIRERKNEQAAKIRGDR